MAKRIKVEALAPAPLRGRPWTSQYDPGVPAALAYPVVPLQALLDDAAESHPDATATIFFNAKRSYRSISDAAWRFANGLRRLGVAKGDRVALVLPNMPQFVIAFYGALRAGAVVVPCNPLYTAPELRRQLADSGTETLVALSRLHAVARAARDGTPVRNLILTNIKEYFPPILRALFTLARGSAMVLIPRFDREHVLLAIHKPRPRSFAGAPRIYVAAASAPDLARYDLRSVEVFQLGSAPLPVEVQTKFEQLAGGGRVLEGYGLTEAAPVTHTTPRQGLRKLGSIGVPIPDVDAKIVDLETGTRDLPVGETGELVLRGPNLMDGYYQRPEETALALRDGWLYTGDVARMDEDGYFYILDRKKELIIVSGYNVYPREVEEALYAHPAVLEAAAIGVPDPERGEVVKAFVVLRPGASATAEDLRTHCASSLARFKIPAEIEFRSDLPKSMVGKVLRRALADEERASRVGSETSGRQR